MHKASFKDFLLLFILAGIWGSAFFNIKIASESYTPMALAFGRIFFCCNCNVNLLLDKKNFN